MPTICLNLKKKKSLYQWDPNFSRRQFFYLEKKKKKRITLLSLVIVLQVRCQETTFKQHNLWDLF